MNPSPEQLEALFPKKKRLGKSRKPTIRKNGIPMYDMRVTFAVGMDEIAAAIQKKWVEHWIPQTEADNPNDGEPWTPDEPPHISFDHRRGRKEIWAAVERLFRDYGSPGCGFWDTALPEQVDLSYDLANKFFPELKAL